MDVATLVVTTTTTMMMMMMRALVGGRAAAGRGSDRLPKPLSANPPSMPSLSVQQLMRTSLLLLLLLL
jgi:hypothetical protein